MKCDRHGEACEDEVGCVVERVADAFAVAERARDHDANSDQRIFTNRQYNEAGSQKRQNGIRQWYQADVDPVRKRGPAAPHSALPPLDAALTSLASRSCAFAINKPSLRSLAWSANNSPTIRPPHMTKMRSERAITSSSSTDTSRMAQPASRRRISWWWMNSMAPISTPRVG